MRLVQLLLYCLLVSILNAPSAAGQVAQCGDGVCSTGEDSTTCPEECPLLSPCNNCGNLGCTTFTSPSGSFSDGSGDRNYNDNANCRWIIAPALATSVSISFSFFDTEGGYDYIRVFSCQDASCSAGMFEQQIAKLEDQREMGSRVFTSFTGIIQVTFTSDSSSTYAGFWATWTSSTCGDGVCSTGEDSTTCPGDCTLMHPIGTFAGSGHFCDGGCPSSRNGDGGPATLARLSQEHRVAVSSITGDVYVADRHNHCVRKIEKSTGGISTFAGTCGSSGSSGDGGPATSALFDNPQGVAVSPTGDVVYVADTYNNRVRKIVVSTGVISTFAGTGSYGYSGDGGPATSALFRNPQGVGLSATTGDVVYVADTYNNRIRKIVVSTGVISTFAGTGSYGYSGDGGPATSADFRYPKDVAFSPITGGVYVTDSESSCIRKIEISTGDISTLAGKCDQWQGPWRGDTCEGCPATSALFRYPFGVAVSAKTGDVYVSDTEEDDWQSTHCIRKIESSTGFVSTVAGTCGYSGYSGDGGSATSALMSHPHGVAVSPITDDLYVSDGLRIRVVVSEALQCSAGTYQEVSRGACQDCPLQSDTNELTGQTTCTCEVGYSLYPTKVNNVVTSCAFLEPGMVITLGGNGLAQFEGYYGFSGDGGPATLAKFSDWIGGVAVSPITGDVYVADSDNFCIRKIEISTGIVTTVAGRENSMFGVAWYSSTFSSSGSGSGSSSGSGSAFRENLGYSGAGIYPATLARLNYPVSVAVSPITGDVYVVDTWNSCVRKIEISTGNISKVAGMCHTSGFSGDGGPATSALLHFPWGVAVSPITGDLYVADTDNHCVRKIEISTGDISTFAGTCQSGAYSGDGGPATSAELYYPRGVAVSPITGDVYVADTDNSCVRKIEKSTGDISTVAGTGSSGYSGDGGPATEALLDYPQGVAVSPITGDVYVADTENHCVRKIEISTGDISTAAGNCRNPGNSGDGGPATSAELYEPVGVDFSPVGHLYVTTRGDSRILAVLGETVSQCRSGTYLDVLRGAACFSDRAYFSLEAESETEDEAESETDDEADSRRQTDAAELTLTVPWTQYFNISLADSNKNPLTQTRTAGYIDLVINANGLIEGTDYFLSEDSPIKFDGGSSDVAMQEMEVAMVLLPSCAGKTITVELANARGAMPYIVGISDASKKFTLNVDEEVDDPLTQSAGEKAPAWDIVWTILTFQGTNLGRIISVLVKIVRVIETCAGSGVYAGGSPVQIIDTSSTTSDGITSANIKVLIKANPGKGNDVASSFVQCFTGRRADASTGRHLLQTNPFSSLGLPTPSYTTPTVVSFDRTSGGGSSGLDGGAIAGIVVGSVVGGLLCLGAVALCMMFRFKKLVWDSKEGRFVASSSKASSLSPVFTSAPQAIPSSSQQQDRFQFLGTSPLPPTYLAQPPLVSPLVPLNMVPQPTVVPSLIMASPVPPPFGYAAA